jgi:hypothetical protein
MPVPTLITDLSTTAASNYPAGTEAPNVIDDTLRAHAAFIAQLRDGPVTLALGSVTAPAYSFVGDTNTGWYAPAADTLAGTTGGVERFRIASTGAVSVTPTSSLSGASAFSVDGTYSGNIVGQIVANRSNTASSDARIWAYVAGTSAGDPFMRFEVDGAGTFAMGVDNSDSDKFKVSGSSALGSNDYLTIDTSGNVIASVTGTAPTLAVNSTMSFELTSNTQLKFAVRGSDGVTRTATLTLA